MVNCERFVNSRFTSNTYIISHSEYDNVWVVDPGDTEVVFEWMKKHSKTTVSGILLTHGHFDHIYGINGILSHYGDCVVYVANEFGKEILHDAKKNGSKYTEEGPTIVNGGAKVEIYPDYLKLWDDTTIRVIYTPGHSDDSVCIIIRDMMFSGDTLIKDIRTVTKLKTGSKEKLSESLRLIEKEKGQGLMVYPGHEGLFSLDDYDLSKSEEIVHIS